MDYRSLFTLLALLITSKAVEFSGAINILSRKMLLFSHRKQFYLVLLIVLSTFLLSSIFTNDAVLFILIPLSLAFSKRIDISRSEIIALVVLAANTGSIMTPFGNPQNIIIWKYYDVDLLFFIYSMIPYSLIGLVVLIIYTYIRVRGKRLEVTAIPGIKVSRFKSIASIVLLLLLITVCELEKYILAILVVVVTIFIYRRELLRTLDYFLLVMFIVMFIDFTSISLMMKTYYVEGFEALLYGIVLSQIISNVPATIVLTNKCLDWYSLAVGVNLGGILLITGSFANIIGIRLGGAGFKEFQLKILSLGLPITVLSILYYLLH